MTSLLPSLTDYFQKKDEGRWDHLISLSFKFLFSSAILIFVLGVLFRDYMIRIIANDDYLLTSHMFNSSDAFLVVLSVIVFYFISLVFIYSLVASNNQGKLLKINIIVTIFNILWNIILIPKYSFMGAGIITLLSQILLMFLGYFYTRKLIHFHLPFVFVLKNLVFAVLIYSIWYYMLSYLSLWLYADFIVYGLLLFGVYSLFLYFLFVPYIRMRKNI